MNNQADMAFSVSANLSPVYTATHFYSGIPIIKNIILKNIPDTPRSGIAINITAKASGDEIMSFSVDNPDFSKYDCLSGNSDTVIINLEKYSILPKSAFIRKLTATTTVAIRVSVTVGETTAVSVQDVKIYPFGHVCPEMPPELLCTYVLPGSEFAAKAEKMLAGHAKKVSQKHSRTAPKSLLYAEALASYIQSVKLTFSAIHREILDGDCIIRDQDKLLESNNRSISLTEAALIYCSCAERCGLRSGIIYLRKGAGPVKVLVSICLGDYYAVNPVSESISELRDKILDKDLFVFDVLGLLGTEETDFARNVTEATNLVLKSNSTLAFCVDIYASRLCGVSSLRPYGEPVKNMSGAFGNIGAAVKRIEKNANSVSLYGYSPYSHTSLGLCLQQTLLDFGKEYTLIPLDDETVCSNPDSFLSISSFVPRNLSKQTRNNTEQAVYDSKLSKLIQKISACPDKNSIYTFPSKYMLSGEKLYSERIRDEIISDTERLCDIVKADTLHSGNTLIYTAVGIVKFTENDNIYYAPCAYVPCTITSASGTLKLKFGVEKTIFNKCLRNYIENQTGASFPVREQEILSTRPSDIISEKNPNTREIKLCLAVYEHICNDYPEMFSFSIDSFVSAFDLSYSLMLECLERSDEKGFECYLESGKYIPVENTQESYDRLEATLPFDVPSDIRYAVTAAENNSIIITGAHGTGKKRAIGNIIARASISGKNILVTSKYSESLSSLYDTLSEGGIAELCLTVKKSDETKRDILNDLELFTKDLERPSLSINSNISGAENELSAFSRDLYSESSFGYSLYDCINEYSKYEMDCPDTSVSLSIDAGNLSKASCEKLFDISDKLIEKARHISELCSKCRTNIGEYLKHIKNTFEIQKNISDILYECAKQLDVLADKTVFARSCLGLDESAITDVNTLLSLGELFGLIMNSGIDFLPCGIVSENSCINAEFIKKACSVIDEIHAVNSQLPDFSSDMSGVSFSELYAKWKEAENKPFAKNSLVHELKKYLLPKSKLSASDAGILLEKLAKRESLENELAIISEEAGIKLGNHITGGKADTERVKYISSFAISLDLCIKKLYKNAREDTVALYNGITKLITSIMENTDVNADFVLAMGAFKKLSGKSGLINTVSGALCADLYELKYKDGILCKNGLSKMLREIGENTLPLFDLHGLNILKKEAVAFGLSGIVEYIETNSISENTGALARKSIFLALANYIVHSKEYPKYEVIVNDYLNYRDNYLQEKKLAQYNVVLSHRKRFRDYINSKNGRNELNLLKKDLSDASLSVSDILKIHPDLFKVMYTAIITQSSFAYRIENLPATLILLDSEKTDTAEALPLCANFDKCIFISSPFERTGSIMSSLPDGIPTYTFSRVLCEKNGYVAAFAESLFKDAVTCLTKDRNSDSVVFVKCPAGLYDKNVRTNKIEAHMVCDVALAAAKKNGFENVGIIALTNAQAAEIKYGLELLANKYSDNRIAAIPVRYIGNMGDLSYDCIVVSVAFGKSIYSTTRSYGITDNVNQLYNGSSACLSELLCCKKILYVVSSLEPEDVMTDNLCKGAFAVSQLISFAKDGAVTVDITREKHTDEISNLEKLLRIRMEKDSASVASRCSNSTLRCGENALIFENGFIKDTYDRIILPQKEAEVRGYNVEISDICGLLENI
ncbi:MAG: hypothetical protein IKI97_10230 [Clostridia bacterium]|nr:hypothetical protein [Clostridia bacterium]